MTLFDRYIAVDWSANNSPKSGKDSIWIAEATRDGHLADSSNPRTRQAAMEIVVERLRAARQVNERVLIGFDFPFGYPAGVAGSLTGRAEWQSLWAMLGAEVSDAADNRSNRFEVARVLNARLSAHGARFWGCPARQAGEFLSNRKVGAQFDTLAEFRQVERLAKGAKTVWQLHYNGSVGSQAILGIARLEALRHHPALGPDIAIWPFQTDFEQQLQKPIVIAEIYPSLLRTLDPVLVKDRAQVEAQVRWFAQLDRERRLISALAAPSAMTMAQRAIAVAEEGWIVGAGQPELRSFIADIAA